MIFYHVVFVHPLVTFPTSPSFPLHLSISLLPPPPLPPPSPSSLPPPFSLFSPPSSPSPPCTSCWSMIRLTSLTIYLQWSAWTPLAMSTSLQLAKMETNSADSILPSMAACKEENLCPTLLHFMLDITVWLRWMTSLFCTHRLRTLHSTLTDAGTGMISLPTYYDVILYYDYYFDPMACILYIVGMAKPTMLSQKMLATRLMFLWHYSDAQIPNLWHKRLISL